MRKPGCIPTKALLHASDMFHMMQSCDEFGVSTDFISFDFGKMQKYKKKQWLNTGMAFNMALKS